MCCETARRAEITSSPVEKIKELTLQRREKEILQHQQLNDGEILCCEVVKKGDHILEGFFQAVSLLVARS